MNKYEKFMEQYSRERSMYEAWGNCVKEYIDSRLPQNPVDYAKIVKIPVIPRVKDTASIIEKAFFRGKDYKDPYHEITDKVGIRYVVMVDRQIKDISKIIEESDLWRSSKDQDFEVKIAEHPNVFDYQSVHYVVRAAREMCFNDIIIQLGIPCEIQIRTLEQHAYAELSHDYFYKSGKKMSADMERNLAKSMALNETTDELFGRVYDMIEKEKKDYYDLTKKLNTIFEFRNYNESLNKSIYDNLEGMIKKYVDLRELQSKVCPFLDNIQENQELVIYQQPMILVLYYLIQEHGKELEDTWDATTDMLAPIYADLGVCASDVY